VPEIPDSIVLERHRDYEGRGWHVWVERTVLAAFLVFVVVALLNVFGQHPSTTRAATPAADLAVYAPTSLRGGLLWEGRITVHAHRDIKNAILVLDGGWLDGFTINTMLPTPLGTSSRDGKLVLTLGHIPARHTYTLWMQSQVNATNVGIDHQDVVLLDGQKRLAKVDHTVTTFP
jgi:hypothetical protein